MARLTLLLFGAPRLELDGVPVEIDRRKAIALIAYLAVTGHEHSRDALATLLWPESDQSSARGALRRTLSVLNKALDGVWLQTTRETIDLKRTADLWLDVAQFRQHWAVYEAHNHASPDLCATCLANLTEVVALYRADFLAGFTLRDSPAFDEWQFFQAENLRRDLAGALERLVLYHCAQSEYEPAITYARRWLELDTLHEPAHQLLIQLYAWTNQRAAALRQYQECVRLLEDELGVSPSAETAALYEQIRTGNLQPEIAVSAGSPRQTYSTRSPVPAPLPPSPSATLPAPSFLSSPPPRPASIIPFVDREVELAQMRAYLESALVGQGQVVFITGEAGSGKTALVQEFTRQAQQTTPNLVVAKGNCNAYVGSGDPYLPFREILNLLTGDIEPKWKQGIITAENASRLWNLFPASVQILLEFGPDLIDTFIPRTTLINRTSLLPADGPNGWDRLKQGKNGGNGAGNVAQSDLFEQFTYVLYTLAQQHPLLLVIDDAQWADVASINLLFHLGRQLTGNRILTFITYRPDDVALGRDGERHPLESVVNELKRLYGDVQIDLDQSAGDQFVEALLDTQTNRLGAEFRTALYDRTQGHPLFTVELLWDMQQRGDLTRDEQGDWIEGPDLNWKTLPTRVEAVIKERLDRLDDHLREFLTIASVEGELFTAQVIARVQDAGERQVLRELSQALEKRHRLIQNQGEIEVGGNYLSLFHFTHTLFQQYLYNTLGAGERRLLHGDIATALDELYAGQTDSITVQLAHHYTEAGQTDKAIDYLLRAGDRARNFYAHQEAADFYQKALTFLQEQRAYERAARTLMKLGLTYHLAFNFQQAREAYEEGFTLWQQAGMSLPATLPPAPHALRLTGYEPPTLDPTRTGDATSAELVDQLFSGLVELSPEMEVMPHVAQSWEVRSDGYEYIFHLRDDTTWSDGVPVTTEDFVYAWRRVLNPANGSPAARLLYNVKGARAFHQSQTIDPDQIGIQALDETTLLVQLEEATSYFLYLLTHVSTYPVPRHVVEAYGEAWTNVENIVTNGPFRLEDRQRGQSITLVRNSEYQGRFIGNLERIELSLNVDTSIPLELYAADRLDALHLWSLSGSEMDRVRQQYADDYLSLPGLNTQYISFDTSRPPFDDPRVRRAFAMAIDKETLAHVVMGGYVSPATGGFVPPGIPGHSAGIGLPYNPDQARQLLAEAGYPDGRNFPAVDWQMTPEGGLVAEYLQTQWRKNLKIDLTWKKKGLETTWYEQLGTAPPHLFCIGWVADYPDPDNFLGASTVQPFTRWRHETFERLIEEARRVTDQAQRMKLYREADIILMEEAAIVPYIYTRVNELVKPWVTRYPISSCIRSTFWKEIIIEPH